MQNSYKSISRVWLDFPDEFNNLSLCDHKIKLKNSFEDKKIYFDDYITKILIIGDVSTGKSTMVNSLLGKTYFETFSGNGTVSFFYCCQTEKDYEYFTINDDLEVEDMDLLKNTQGLNDSFRDFIDQNSIFKAYIKNDVNKLLQKKTVIVDCPGFDHSEYCDEKIKFHCLTADIIIFIFDYKSPATPKQKEKLKEIKKQIRNPIFLFVYNKCDEIEFDDEKLKKLEKDFNDTFNELYQDASKLYFISAKEPMLKGFEQLKTDILDLRKVNYIRYLNVRSLLSKAISAFKENLEIFISLQKREKTGLEENLNQMTNKSNALNKDYSNILDSLRNIIDGLLKNFDQEKFFNIILMNVKNYDGKCTKHDARDFINKLANTVDRQIREDLETILNNRVISIINNKFEDIKNEEFNEIDIVKNKQFNIDHFFSILNTDMKLNIFWPHEKGCKTKKVQKAYIKFLKSKTINENIIEKISQFYNDQLLKIQADFVASIELSKQKNCRTINKLREDFKNKENIIELLEKYETNVKEFIQDYNVFLY